MIYWIPLGKRARRNAGPVIISASFRISDAIDTAVTNYTVVINKNQNYIICNYNLLASGKILPMMYIRFAPEKDRIKTKLVGAGLKWNLRIYLLGATPGSTFHIVVNDNEARDSKHYQYRQGKKGVEKHGVVWVVSFCGWLATTFYQRLKFTRFSSLFQQWIAFF